jgi:spore maturation protein SpmA
MALNYVWIFFFLAGFVIAIVRTCYGYFGGGTVEDMHIFETIGKGTFDSAKAAFNVALGLTGVITLWMGLLRVGEKAGAINFLSRIIGPFFKRLFPEIPDGHPAQGQIMLNFSANMLGVSNAATPIGLKAMASLQDLNQDKNTASNSMIMFLTLNTAGLTLIPVSIMALRAQMNPPAANPTDVFVPILITTFIASMLGMVAVAIRQKINLFDKVLLSWLLGGTAIMAGIIVGLLQLDPKTRSEVSLVAGNAIIMAVIVAFILGAVHKKENVFQNFIEGAKEGFNTMVRIIPYLVAMIVAIGIFRNCGALIWLVDGCKWFFAAIGVDTQFCDALTVAFMKPLSGSGAEGMALDVMKTHGVDSFAGRLASVMYASADTTFYIIALYFGSVGIQRIRYAVWSGLFADLMGIVSAIFVSYLFWG